MVKSAKTFFLHRVFSHTGCGILLDEKSLPNLLKEGQLSSDLSTTVVSDEEFNEVFNKLKLPQFTVDKWNDFRKADWLNILEFPEIALKSTQQLLAVA